MPKLPVISILALAACFAAAADAQEKCYEFYPKGGNQVFRAVTSKPAVIEQVEAQLRLSPDKRMPFISGKLARGNGGHNAPWSWHFLPADWVLADFSIEVCDGEPNYVEKNLDTWMEQVGRYCPWGGQVIRACPTTGIGFRLSPAHGSIAAPRGVITCEIPAAGRVSLELLRVDGTRIATLIEGSLPAGSHSVPPRDFASGVYQLLLRLDGKTVAARSIAVP